MQHTFRKNIGFNAVYSHNRLAVLPTLKTHDMSCCMPQSDVTSIEFYVYVGRAEQNLKIIVGVPLVLGKTY